MPGAGGPLNSVELVRRSNQDVATIPDHHVDLLDVGLVQVQSQLLRGEGGRRTQQVLKVTPVPSADNALGLRHDIGPVGGVDIDRVARVDMPLLGFIDNLQS